MTSVGERLGAAGGRGVRVGNGSGKGVVTALDVSKAPVTTFISLTNRLSNPISRAKQSLGAFLAPGVPRLQPPLPLHQLGRPSRPQRSITEGQEPVRHVRGAPEY